MSSTAGWASIPLNDGHVHVVPLEDGLIHEPEDTCICGPEIESVPRDDGTIAWLVTHASLDGREHSEP